MSLISGCERSARPSARIDLNRCIIPGLEKLIAAINMHVSKQRQRHLTPDIYFIYAHTHTHTPTQTHTYLHTATVYLAQPH